MRRYVSSLAKAGYLGLLLLPLAAHGAVNNCPASSENCLDSPNDLGIVETGIDVTVKGIVEILLTAAGFLAVIFVIIGGIRYMTSNGNASAVADAKQTITYAIIGLVVAVTARLIVGFVIGNSPQ